mmetsp:Transcript_3489/g.7606  ORF Transcript_3489/g.7606 Transcript_3489/m.7606 type:complete len:388 (-) Transcript_3489:164-1327(-)
MTPSLRITPCAPVLLCLHVCAQIILVKRSSAFSAPPGANSPSPGTPIATPTAAAAAAAADSSSSQPDIIRSFAIFENFGDHDDNNTRRCIGRCDEIRPKSRDPNADEDEVELFYQTTHRSFAFPYSWTDEVEEVYQTTGRSFLFPRGDGGWDEATEAERLLKADCIHQRQVNIRQTSFGCGRLGATIWPSGIALASLLSGDMRTLVEGRRVLELGSGCGLPTLVSKDICGASDVLATDYWEEEDGKFDADRLVPKHLFGANLAYNLGSSGSSAVKRLDWHDTNGIIYAADQFRPDVIIGSDLVYYPMDTPPLLETLNVLFSGGASDGVLILPLPPAAEREALPDFRSRLENGALENCEVEMDELVMVGKGNEDRHDLLRIHIRGRPL